MDEIVYTIGHSLHPLGRFIALLKKHAITHVCDVRSHPYSRVSPQFNRESLQQELEEQSIAYVFLGKELGARSDDPLVYVNGKVSFDRLAKTALFLNGLERVQEGAKSYRAALMCVERDPLACHRMVLISRHLHESGLHAVHILEDGGLETHQGSLIRLLRLLRLPESDLFRSQKEIIEEAYKIQGERIAYDPQKGVDQLHSRDKDRPL